MKVIPNNPETANLLFDICEAMQGIDLFNKSWKITNKGTISIEFTDKIKVGDICTFQGKTGVISDVNKGYTFDFLIDSDSYVRDFKYFGEVKIASKYRIEEMRTNLAKRGIGYNGKIFKLVRRREGCLYRYYKNGTLTFGRDYGHQCDIDRQRDGNYFPM